MTIEAGIAGSDKAPSLLMIVWPSQGNAGISTGIEPVASIMPFAALISICSVWFVTTTVFADEAIACAGDYFDFVCLDNAGQAFSETGDDCVFTLLHFWPVG